MVLRLFGLVLAACLAAATPAAAQRAYIADFTDSVTVIDAGAQSVVQRIQIAPGVRQSNVLKSRDNRRVYVAGGAGVSVIDVATNTVVARGAAELGAQALALSPDGTRLYAAEPGFTGEVYVFDAATLARLDSFVITGVITALAVSPDGSRLYATHQCAPNADAETCLRDFQTAGAFTAYDLAADEPDYVLPVSGVVLKMALTPDGRFAYLADQDAQTSMTRIDTGTQELTFSNLSGLSGVAVTADGTVGVVSFADGGVGFFDPATVQYSGRFLMTDGQAYGVALADNDTTILTTQRGPEALVAFDRATGARRVIPYDAQGGNPINLTVIPSADDAPQPEAVPTLSEWAMMLMALMLAGGAALVIDRRRPAA